jgi:hypothetical protein
MTLKSSTLYGNDSTTEKPVRWEKTLMKDEREERKGTIMGHIFMTIFSWLATVGMVLVIMWGMSILDPQGQGFFQSSAKRHVKRPNNPST